MIATASGFEFLNAKLAPDTGVGGFMTFVSGLFRGVAPAGQTSPWGVLQAQSPPRRILTLDDYLVFSDGLFVAKAVGESRHFAAMVSAIKRADTLLRRTSGTVSDGSVLVCVAEDEVSYEEDNEGITYSHLGLVLRLLLQ